MQPLQQQQWRQQTETATVILSAAAAVLMKLMWPGYMVQFFQLFQGSYSTHHNIILHKL
jgi:hypothetical protein